MTTSEVARHGRAELEAIVAGLEVTGLARLLEVARRLLEEQDANADAASVEAARFAPVAASSASWAFRGLAT